MLTGATAAVLGSDLPPIIVPSSDVACCAGVAERLGAGTGLANARAITEPFVLHPKQGWCRDQVQNPHRL